MQVLNNSFNAGLGCGALFCSGGGGLFDQNLVRNHAGAAIAGVVVKDLGTSPKIGNSDVRQRIETAIRKNVAAAIHSCSTAHAAAWSSTETLCKDAVVTVTQHEEASGSSFVDNSVGILVAQNSSPVIGGNEFVGNEIGVSCQALLNDGLQIAGNAFLATHVADSGAVKALADAVQEKGDHSKLMTGVAFRQCHLSDVCTLGNIFFGLGVGMHSELSAVTLFENMFVLCEIGARCAGQDHPSNRLTITLARNVLMNATTGIRAHRLSSDGNAVALVASATTVRRIALPLGTDEHVFCLWLTHSLSCCARYRKRPDPPQPSSPS